MHSTTATTATTATGLLDVHQVAAILRCSVCTVRRLGYRRVLRTYKVEGSTLVRYAERDVLGLLRERSRP